MCGFVVLVGDQSLSKEDFRPMLDSIQSRGPDDAGYAESDWFSVGFCRLSIVVLSEEGRQPVSDTACGISLVFNGELYNYREIARQLQQESGVAPASEAEALLRLYQREGTRFIEQLDGDYAIVVLDSRSKTCLAFRDHFGVKPLYYAGLENGRRWMICSHVKPFFRHPGFATDLDPVALTERRVLGFWSSERTCFEGIHQLVPGRYLRLDVSNDHGTTAIRQTLGPASMSATNRVDAGQALDAGQICIRCGDAIARAIRKRIEHSDVLPIVLALSGGIDSSLMTTLAGEWREQLAGLTVFDTEESLDRDCATRLARHIGLRHEAYRIEFSEFLTEFPRVVLEMAGPCPSYTPYFLARAMKHLHPSAKVLLCGEGADEFFVGYPLFLNDDYLRNAAAGLDECSPELVAESALLQRVARWESLSPHAAWCDLVEMFQQDQLVNLHLVPFDHGTMAHGVECRVPFLDDAVVQSVQVMPARLRVLGNTAKILLRILLAQTLGRGTAIANTLLSRRSSPAYFSTLHCWNALRQLIRERLPSSRLAGSPLADAAPDPETLFWLASVTTIFLKHRGWIDGMTFSDLASEVFDEPVPVAEFSSGCSTR
jgi:asparagine synthase (glutamine-hydrolysing)